MNQVDKDLAEFFKHCEDGTFPPSANPVVRVEQLSYVDIIHFADGSSIIYDIED